MEGLNALGLYLKLIQKYMEFLGDIHFRIEDFQNGNPARIEIIEKDEKGKVLKNYILYGSIDDDILSLTDEKGNDMIKKYQKKQKLSDEEKEKQMLEFTRIIRENKKIA